LIGLPLNGAVLHQAVRKFLHKQGVPSRFAENKLSQLLDHLAFFQYGLYESGTALGGKLSKTNLYVIGLAHPCVPVFRTVEKNQQNMGVWQPVYQIIQELLGGLVDPVEVLHGQQERSLLTLPDEQVPDSLKDLRLSLLWLDLQVFLVFHLDGEKLMEGGKGAQEFRIELGEPFLHLLLDQVFPVFLLDVEIGLHDVQDGQAGHGAPKMEATPLQVCAAFPGKPVPEL